MTPSAWLGVVWAIVMAGFVVLVWMTRRTRRGHIGPGASGAIHDMLNEDKRKAVEIIVEQKAEARRPEYPDGNLPDLESPRRR